ncbi:MAG: TVP38/TMEM64 family protein, partial [Syntrophomonadaceae bacterium]|nr:TVP38/TMEM64 family protein [Syntrophomonadaceae bacterium]MDD3898962.1 TVP38/TMEM64 family protein [Syntrophomonadaceae bacterium]
MDKKVWKQWWFKIVLLVIPVLLYYLVPAFQEIIQNAVKVLSRVDVDAAREYILSFGIWAPVVSFFLMVFQSVAAPLPAFVITFANAGL